MERDTPGPGTMPLLRLGTSSWSCKDWLGKFYPAGTVPGAFIGHYATRFATVEVDSTFYGTPGRRTVERWRDLTPPSFVFAAKAPQTITHEKCMEDCERDLAGFLDTMEILGARLGPILFQFPYYAKKNGMTCDDFCARLKVFVAQLPLGEFQFAVEIRNKTWLEPRLLDILRDRGIALALIDHPWMARPQALMRLDDPVTGPFAYIRWLGDRHGIEKMTKTWNETVVDRRKDLLDWVPAIRDLLTRNVPVFGYFNNHYAGYAPGSLGLLESLLSSDAAASTEDARS